MPTSIPVSRFALREPTERRGPCQAAVVSLLHATALVVAGVLAGLVGSAGGITSLVSYPALLAVGLAPLPASIANNLALIACWPGSAVASRSELRGEGAWLRRWLPVAALGGALGSVALVETPAGSFERIVPFLVLAGSLALLLEPRLTAWHERRHGEAGRVALAVGLGALSFYNGYFGAGSGVLTLTLVLVLVEHHLPTANALKNMLIGAGVLASGLVFLLVASVRWSAVWPLALGMLVGSTLGPRVARRVPRRALRLTIVALGVALAIELLVNPGG